MSRRRACALVLVAALAGCARDGERAWRRADAAWRARDPGAWRDWRALDPATRDGHAAHQRLAAADAAYRRGIALLAAGAPDARSALATAAASAPMDPALYLPLARACRAQKLDERAAELYAKFLAQAPPGADADAARAELAALGTLVDAVAVLDRGAPPPDTAYASAAPLWPWALVATLAAVALAALAVGRRARRRRWTLAQLAAASPELQPAIAFLVGCLRHELLKHRILAVGDAVRALAAGPLHAAERGFLATRLYGGEPLPVAWAGHLSAFMRALGPRFDLLRHDPSFRAADRAIAAIAASAAGLERGDSAAAERIARAQAQLRDFDAALGALSARLQHTVVDRALLDGVVAEVTRELGGRAVLDELTVTPPPPAVAVEIYRLDLTLALRNVLRNAWVAAAAGPMPRRVCIDVAVALEPTGEEIVRLCVRDSNPAPLPQPSPSGPGNARGLGLTRSALERYDGALAVEPGGDGFAKCVVLRLFRALDPIAEAA